MKVKAFLQILLVVLIVSGGCGRKAVRINPNFIGVWSGNSGTVSYHLSIDETGMALWQRSSPYLSAQGEARIRNGELHIGIQAFHIDEYPTPDANHQTWQMKLSGVLYTR